MEFLQPETWAEALQMKAAHPQAVPIQGGTDVMVELNFDRYRPEYLLDLTRVASWRSGRRTTGASGWARASATRASSPSSATGCPGWRWRRAPSGRPRSATGARSAATSAPRRRPATPIPRCWPPAPRSRPSRCTASRQIPAEEFYTGVKRNALAPDELIKAVLIAPPAGPQQFCKIGTRNAMVISVAAFGLALHPDREAVGTGIGSAAPTPRRALAAEQFLAQSLTDDGLWESRGALPDATSRTSPTWSRTPPPRSTTYAGPPGTASTPCPSWPGAR
jgi:hypothetical protein